MTPVITVTRTRGFVGFETVSRAVSEGNDQGRRQPNDQPLMGRKALALTHGDRVVGIIAVP